MAPFDMLALFGKLVGYSVYLLIGIAFGYALEVAGFGDSRKLSAQFYFRDMTVLKVMFTAIIVAMTLIFGGAALGWIDFARIYVNLTYLWPQIVGGLIMGFGFIVGGFCPGTSLVAMASLKLDGLFFLGGVFGGVWLFGDTVGFFSQFYESGYQGRLIIPDWLGVDAGLAVFAIVVIAIAAFALSGWAERRFGPAGMLSEAYLRRRRHLRRLAAAALCLMAFAVAWIKQPDPIRRWDKLSQVEEQRISRRDVFVHPAELLELQHNPQIYLRILDIRGESDFNLFHLQNALCLPLAELGARNMLARLGATYPNTITIIAGNDENLAAQAYRVLIGQGLMNVYVLEGGINGWLHHFAAQESLLEQDKNKLIGQEPLAFQFAYCLGEHVWFAAPDKEQSARLFGHDFAHRVKLQVRKGPKGGCG